MYTVEIWQNWYCRIIFIIWLSTGMINYCVHLAHWANLSVRSRLQPLKLTWIILLDSLVCMCDCAPWMMGDHLINIGLILTSIPLPHYQWPWSVLMGIVWPPGASRASRKGGRTSTPPHLWQCPGICCTKRDHMRMKFEIMINMDGKDTLQLYGDITGPPQKLCLPLLPHLVSLLSDLPLIQTRQAPTLVAPHWPQPSCEEVKVWNLEFNV